jgi:predicted transcriptional regulator
MSETEVKALKQQIKKYIDAADERMLRIVFTMLEADTEKDWWDDLPKEVQDSIDEGLKDIEEGNFITHEEFMKRNERWFKK